MSEPRQGRIVHAVPGRVRVRLEPDDHTGAAEDELRSPLMAVPGVQDVKVTPRTNSLVIYYDPSSLDVPRLIDLARAANLLALEGLKADAYGQKQVPMSITARRVSKTFHEVDVRLSEITDARWDLRSVVPFAFGALALRQLIRDFGSFGSAPWYVLAWYAFDSFWKLNQSRQGVEPGPDLEPTIILPADG